MLLLLGVLLLLAANARAEEAARKVIHDGVEMDMKVGEDSLTIAYGEPPAQLREIGVSDGQVLVTGIWTRRDPSVLVGHAFAFAPRCPPIQYDIRGIIDAGGSLVVIGPTPILKLESCEVAQLVWSDDAVMEFAPPRPDVTVVEKKKRRRHFEEAEKPKPKPKPKPQPRRVAPQPQQPYYYPPYYQQPSPWRW